MLVPATTRIIVYCASVLAMIGAYRLSGSPSAEITAAVAAFVAGIELLDETAAMTRVLLGHTQTSDATTAPPSREWMQRLARTEPSHG